MNNQPSPRPLEAFVVKNLFEKRASLERHLRGIPESEAERPELDREFERCLTTGDSRAYVNLVRAIEDRYVETRYLPNAPGTMPKKDFEAMIAGIMPRLLLLARGSAEMRSLAQSVGPVLARALKDLRYAEAAEANGDVARLVSYLASASENLIRMNKPAWRFTIPGTHSDYQRGLDTFNELSELRYFAETRLVELQLALSDWFAIV